ncbi:MAG: rhomboid family intramembrane serine protease [Bacteroidales bacterium]|nr:rhomboid family intramembrane serine protease [Bacteroidales bacterium]MDY3356564.1 rhomboid family intramembrane serine protease [Prevotella sp.]MCI7763353.1 rhomboid family intramembrane serine protease [Bacteroidales bacterium]MDD7103230.1 rhomboid family intramembrane serine protease [Bacteroidales bacterium]MDD7124791.1 rhomboid family intramembrane serine protease [Bacteroidales bacterium]
MFRQIPPITKNLLIINVLAYLAAVVMKGSGIDFNEIFGLHFFMADNFHLYQLVTYMFMHGGVTHLFFNMFALWMFGCVIEQTWGSRRFLWYILACGVGAGLFQEAAQFVQYAVEGLAAFNMVNVGGMIIPTSEYLNMWVTVGFSGAVYGILLGFGMTYPEERIFIFPLPVPIKGKWFVMLYAAIELFSALSTSSDGVAHIAHLGGMAVGYIIIRHWRQQYERRQRASSFNGWETWDGYEIRTRESLKDKISAWWKRNMQGGKRHYNQESHYDKAEKNRKEHEEQEEMDRILEKIKRSGYDSLTDEERRKLFDRK